MTAEISIAFATFLLLVIGVYSDPKKRKSRLVSILIIILGVITFCMSSYKSYSGNLREITKDEKIDQLATILNIRNDTITELKNDITKLKVNLDSMRFEVDSINQIALLLNQSMNSAFVPIFSDRIEIDDGSILSIGGTLIAGMEIRVRSSNCHQSIAFIHNKKREIIREDNSGTWETKISETGRENESFLLNEGQSPCGMIIEIFASNANMNKVGDKVKIIKQTADKRHLEPPSITCLLEEVRISGVWQMVMDYDNCLDPESEINWTDLIVYFYIDEFKLINSKYTLKGNKFAENYEGNYMKYSKLFPINSSSGYLDSHYCEIVIPIEEEYESKDNKNLRNEGYIRINEVERVQDRVILHGYFNNTKYHCKGTVSMIRD